jgi:DNA-binding IclR family transcriptional regulator
VGAALDGRVGTGGAAIVHAGVEADTTAISVPIRSNGDIVAAINVVGPSFRMNRATQHDIADAAVTVAAALELAAQVR